MLSISFLIVIRVFEKVLKCEAAISIYIENGGFLHQFINMVYFTVRPANAKLISFKNVYIMMVCFINELKTLFHLVSLYIKSNQIILMFL